MTWTLVKEQLRSRHSYLVWSVALIALAAGLASFAWGTVLSEQAFLRHSFAMRGGERAHSTQIAIVDGGEDLARAEQWGVPMTAAEFDSLLADANAEGAEAVAAREGWALSMTGIPGPNGGVPQTGLVLSGDVRWDVILSSGEPPGAGDVVVQASVADSLGATVGDSVEIAREPMDNSGIAPSVGTRVITGIAYNDGGESGRGHNGVFYLSEADLTLVAESMREANDGAGTELNAPLTVALRWNHDTPSLASAIPASAAWDEGGWGVNADAQIVILALVVTGGVLVTAFAVGRAQAQERARWTATARALGSTRGRLVRATLIEGIVIGGIGGAVGMVCGLAAAAASHSAGQATLTAPPPVAFTVSSALAITVVLGGVMLGLVIAGVPAFLSARVPPSAALKDVSTIDEMEVTRRVPVTPVAVLFGLSYVGALSAMPVDNDQRALAIAVAAIAGVTSGLALIVEMSRRTARWLGRLLSARAEPVAIRAGLELSGHPRQAGALITVQCVASVGLTAAICAYTVGSASFGWLASTANDASFELIFHSASTQFHWEMTVAIAIIAQTLCASIFVGTRRIARKDDAIASGLGLDARSERMARAIRYAAPQMIGLAAGSALALPLIGSLFSSYSAGAFAGDGGLGFLWSVAILQALLTIVIGLGVLAGATSLQSITRRSRVRHPEHAR
ncbi:FtsX-like permease family protein [Demequina aestuarii]|uniref:FtsX-like permease family protein n=1 Tax=Demequina aestuarii TaxID=327095 RepID=UPI0007817FD7|nr:FtsX-like permease family protein [Demequina aestuarii]